MSLVGWRFASYAMKMNLATLRNSKVFASRAGFGSFNPGKSTISEPCFIASNLP
jgi:hypothetical protein